MKMSQLILELTYDVNTSKVLTFNFTGAQLQRLHSLLCGPTLKTIKIGSYYFHYSGSDLGHNTNKEHPSKYGFYERPSEIKEKIRKLLLQ